VNNLVRHCLRPNAISVTSRFRSVNGSHSALASRWGCLVDARCGGVNTMYEYCRGGSWPYVAQACISSTAGKITLLRVLRNSWNKMTNTDQLYKEISHKSKHISWRGGGWTTVILIMNYNLIRSRSEENHISSTHDNVTKWTNFKLQVGFLFGQPYASALPLSALQ
jgi:hypothetical protein